MKIQTAFAPGLGGGVPLKLGLGDGQAVTVAVGTPTTSPVAPGTERKSTALIAPLLAATSIPAVAKGGYWLVSNLNDVTPEQFAGQLQHFHIVNDAGMAHSQANEWLAWAQSKGANSILLGGVAGVTAFAVVETIRPAWPFWAKAGIAIAVAAAVAALLFYGFKDKAPPPKAAPIAKTSAV
jgi:hypothetical protein